MTVDLAKGSIGAYNGMIFEPVTVSYKVAISMTQFLAMRAYEKEASIGQSLESRVIHRSAVTKLSRGIDIKHQAYVRVTLPAGDDTTEMMDHIAYLIKTHATKCLEVAIKDEAEFV